MKNEGRKDDAFTGLEAAIVLIAFVVVAAVFSYVVLGAGFFTTQKSQETVYAATKQASANLAESGPVVLQIDSNGTYVKTISFNLKPAAGASPMDLTKITYHLTTTAQDVLYIDQNATGSSPKISRIEITGDHDHLLETDEMWKVTIDTTVPTEDVLIGTNDLFSIEIKPDVGASLLLQKHAPAGFTANSYYEVY
ncbi:MAG: flagellin [Methanolinea sp.]|nr:flagellin [Methanolinea sp.]